MNTDHLTYLSRWERMMVEYGFYHQKMVNLVTHFVGVPVILMSVFIPLSWLYIGPYDVGGVSVHPNMAWIVAFLMWLFYYRLDRQLALLSLPFFFVLLLLAHELAKSGVRVSGIIAVVGFFGGYALQFAGHALEGKKPALAGGHPQQAVLTAPLFVIAEVVTRFGFRKELMQKVEREIRHLEEEGISDKIRQT